MRVKSSWCGLAVTLVLVLGFGVKLGFLAFVLSLESRKLIRSSSEKFPMTFLSLDETTVVVDPGNFLQVDTSLVFGDSRH